MKMASRRARRMDRHHKMAKSSPLNLVSLMDIFTILVFFLLVNSSSTQQLPKAEYLTLPKSSAKKVPADTALLVITSQSVLLEGREILKLSELENTEGNIVEPLKLALEEQKNNRLLKSVTDEDDIGESITIMGDENISYALLHKILSTCQKARYTNIAFAAHQATKAQ